MIPAMSSTNLRAQQSPSAPAGDRRLRWIVTGLFCLIFGFSALWNLVDPEGGRLDYLAHGYPGYVVYPVAIAKLAGIGVILWGRSRTLTDLAFAGFLYDLMLALGAHLAEGEAVRGVLALITLVVTVGAWWLDRQRFASASSAESARSRSVAAG